MPLASWFSQHLQMLWEALSVGGGIGSGSSGAILVFPLLFFSRGADAQPQSLLGSVTPGIAACVSPGCSYKGCFPLCMAPQSPGRARGRERGRDLTQH